MYMIANFIVVGIFTNFFLPMFMAQSCFYTGDSFGEKACDLAKGINCLGHLGQCNTNSGNSINDEEYLWRVYSKTSFLV